MSSLSHRRAMASATATCFLAALFVARVSTWGENAIGDGLSDEGISPPCQIGSLQSWQGRPCVVPKRDIRSE